MKKKLFSRFKKIHILIKNFFISPSSKTRNKIYVTSKVIEQIPIVRNKFPDLCFTKAIKKKKDAKLYIGWGRKPSGQKAVKNAKLNKVPYIILEDGFLRSNLRDDKTLSIISDDIGVYYDSNEFSRIEELIPKPLTELEKKRTERLIYNWKKLRLSKYNFLNEYKAPLKDPYVLVIDQTVGDLSIKYGNANKQTFTKMLEAALNENPSHEVIIKVHPDTIHNNKNSHFNLELIKQNPRITVISDLVHPVRLIEGADVIYSVTSQIGFEALIWGKKVRCFGIPFYAGWGLTQDEQQKHKRNQNVDLEQLVHAVFINYTTYLDPISDEICEVERLMNYINLQHKLIIKYPKHINFIGFSPWKVNFIKKFFPCTKIDFYNKINYTLLKSKENIAVWGTKIYDEIPSEYNLIRIEDGFLRSKGLGAHLVPPLSLAIDKVGIYFDASRPSEIENFLNNHIFTTEEIERAAALRDKIVEHSLSKYNVEKGEWNRPYNIDKIILVIGQVENDASIKYGSPNLKLNYDLLKRVRSENPNGYILYKPHPDVIAKTRKQGIKDQQIKNLCDEIIGNVDNESLLSQTDELHTMTSLIGFEALLRGTRVICHGIPFYAGWGLTSDRITCPRRRKKLSIEELTYGALIAYPIYVHPKKNVFIEPEEAIDIIARLKTS